MTSDGSFYVVGTNAHGVLGMGASSTISDFMQINSFSLGAYARHDGRIAPSDVATDPVISGFDLVWSSYESTSELLDFSWL